MTGNASSVAEAFRFPAEDYIEPTDKQPEFADPPTADENTTDFAFPQELDAQQLEEVKLALDDGLLDSDFFNDVAPATRERVTAIVPPLDSAAANDKLVFTVASCSSPGSPFDTQLADEGFGSGSAGFAPVGEFVMLDGCVEHC